MPIPVPATPSADVAALAAERHLVTRPVTRAIVRDEYTPALLGLLNNVLVWGGARVFHHLHRIGTNEWRILSALANYPGATASELCDVLGINKSAASKSVNALLERELIAQIDGFRGSRHLYLTEAGGAVHSDLMPIALRRQAILQEALSEGEIEQLNALLVRMLTAEESLREYERTLIERTAGEGDHSSSKTKTRANGSPGR